MMIIVQAREPWQHKFDSGFETRSINLDNVILVARDGDRFFAQMIGRDDPLELDRASYMAILNNHVKLRAAVKKRGYVQAAVDGLKQAVSMIGSVFLRGLKRIGDR
jgi:hypothetical protein